MAMKPIRCGESVEAQLNSAYQSHSDFRDELFKIMVAPPTKFDAQYNILYATWIDTVLGPMIAIADDHKLHLLEFIERRGLEREIERLRNFMKAAIVPGKTIIIDQIEDEIKQYFAGKLKQFKTDIFLIGSEFQKIVWLELTKVPYGQTRSYTEQAQAIDKIKAVRAVANANGANQFAIIIPCHRIINNDGRLGGYGGGINRKKWLLEHEKKFSL